ncbi:mitochondrial intermediate peptidase, mitochondrial isoform X1 [Cynara cardunculus var. scolymus]|uniref:mitochondrial intermediate peptidase, mitochondrial isoform X1 n=1 Tax=Cynara cardunculus var. scolymus TaxID=59895 RepID=UPI000D62D4C5|nr:mitochondrial intermediate peptidase, mitochondrial isoform X1 [Cynara cardunculus var. scolymus]
MASLIRRAASSLCSNSNNRHFFAPAAIRMEDTGLYGCNHLKTPKGFQRIVDEAIERSNELVGYISRMPSSAEIINAMDEISNTVCQVVDSAELCRHTHPDREFVDEAVKASMRINEYLHYLNTNLTLYDAVLKADQDPTLTSEEAKRVAHDLRIDFEKGGIHLCAEKKDRVSQLNVEIAKCCAQYNENIAKEPGHVDVYPASCIPKNLHHLVKPVNRSSSAGSRVNFRDKGFRIVTEPSTVSAVLQWTSDDEARKMTYIQSNSVPHANLGVLDNLIAARHEIAQIMGYKSYAGYALHSNMASSPDVVSSFLVELSKNVQPKAVEEFKSIRDFKRGKSGQHDIELEPWDEAYFTRSMKSSAYNLDFSVVASYFSLSQCIEGLKLLVESLFGVKFLNIPLTPGESWHPDVMKMALHHPDEGDLGYIYLDLNSRRGKYPGCAHFAIRGGRRLSKTEYQLPIIALVCNFSKPHNSATVRLNHSDVDTLFHEFGHALHSLLSRTDHQHFSGTRVAFDMAETPSNLFEYYAWDYRVLKKFARHYSTGDIIPEKLVESMQGARKMFSAMELQQQIFYALADQALYGDQTYSPIDTTSIVADLREQHTNWKHVEGTHWQTRFSHLLYYGAGYYSYLYAKCFASTIWERVCKDDPLSLETGSAIRTKLLQHGGAKDPAQLLNDLAGDGIIRYQNGGIVPDITSLCNEMNLRKR